MIVETVKNYKSITTNIDKLIKASGYKISWIEDQMGMDRVSFYNKRKHNKFSVDEIEKLLSIIRADELEDKVLGEMSLEAEKESETLTLEEAFGESRDWEISK